ncbi:hypothetical protein [Tahibacter amnicola]|uniref:Hpt domain-containing protein n=1 Tax=Tahibacter amnicola TaxID=2976241 RepID=A0ABY6BG08_9GAMM|nr:hypothetical protein [Tahibacter amnicola]UXI68536.1 hypothetical protein N4264_02455 [Tahibacter amnicola]
MNSSPHGLPADEFCLADVLVNAFDADADSAETIVDAARGRRDRALAGLRTLAAVLRRGKSGAAAPGNAFVHGVGALVAHLADEVHALTMLEAHARYRLEEVDREARAVEVAA